MSHNFRVISSPLADRKSDRPWSKRPPRIAERIRPVKIALFFLYSRYYRPDYTTRYSVSTTHKQFRSGEGILHSHIVWRSNLVNLLSFFLYYSQSADQWLADVDAVWRSEAHRTLYDKTLMSRVQQEQQRSPRSVQPVHSQATLFFFWATPSE